jgi:hypothetical protein
VLGAQPVFGQARVSDIAACLNRVQVGEVSGDAAAELRRVAGVAVAGDDRGDARDAGEQAEARAVAAERVGGVQVGQRDLNVGEHVPGDQHPLVGEEDSTVARRVRIVRVDERTRPRPVDLLAEQRVHAGEQGQVVAGRPCLDVAEQPGLLPGGDGHGGRRRVPGGVTERS